MTRGTMLAEVEKHITKDNIVIMDSLNYIKGYRYELFCRARTQRSPICMVYCNVPIETSKLWNEQREKIDSWDGLLFKELCKRFEAPNPRNRWDRPLYTLKSDERTPLEDIKNSLFDNAQTVTKKYCH